MTVTPRFGDPASSGGEVELPHVEWPQVVAIMRGEAIVNADESLHLTTNRVEAAVAYHWYGWSEGCKWCQLRPDAGRVDMWACPEWNHVHAIAFTWLAQRAGLAR